MSLPPERIDATHDLVYLAKHPFYEFALTRSTPSYPDSSSEQPLVQLRFTSQPPHPGIALTLTGLEHFHDALGRLLDYVKQERARRTAISMPDTSMQGPMPQATERVEYSMDRHHREAHHPVVCLNRQASAGQVCRLSGVVLAGLITLLSWALYSLSVGKGEFRPRQATAAQEVLPRSHAASVPQETPGREEEGAQQATAQADDAPRISLHIQSPDQHAAAQRLADRLQQKGYSVPKAAILVAKGPSRTEVRYFHTAEAEGATAIAVLLHEAYRPPVATSYIRGHKAASPDRSQRYEIWLGPERH
jgi:hypothetical protein